MPLPRGGRARPPLRLSVFQPVERDFAFIVDRELPAEALVRAARAADRTLIADIRLFDVFEGEGLGQAKNRSRSPSLCSRPTDPDRRRDRSLLQAPRRRSRETTGGMLRG